MTDSQSLTNYVRTGSDDAFRELIARYLDLVYSAALRLVDGDAHRAEDVTQTVFADLARMARTLPGEVMLGGWLHRHTCFVAANLMRSERRRQSRERQAVEMNALQVQPETDFTRVAPILDEAINELGEADRTAILLRFFEQRDFRAVGEALGSGEDAARMRVNRALEKLESLLKLRGVTASSAALSIVLTANAVQAAPAGLALTISTAAALGGTAVAATATATATKAIAMTTLQKTVIGTTLAVAVGTGIYEARQASVLRSQVQTLQQQAPLAERIQQMQQERDEATNQIARLNEAILNNQKDNLELLRLRGEVGQLRRQLLETAAKTNTTPPRIEFGLPYSRRDKWAEEGTDEPMNTVLTMLWATKQNDEARLAQLVYPGITNQSIDQLTIRMRDRETIVGAQMVTVSTSQFVNSGRLQDVAQVEAILQVKVPVLGKEILDNRMRRWSLSKTNGEWLFTSGR